jgi:SPP1 gp7 family putative phage head morphogenesis protein
MILAHLLALRDTGVKKLQLSSYDRAISVVNRQMKVNLRKLQAKYETDALRIVNNVSEKVDRELRETFLELLQGGAHVKEARAALEQKFDDLGLTEKSGFEIDTIFRTQSQIAYGAGSWEADQDPDVQEILWGYRYSAVGDGRTRPVHAALDGVTLPKDDPFWQTFWPPNGWNCRCTIIQLFSPEPEVYPPDVADDGEPIAPDPGFGFNPGRVFALAVS